jgi:hypothetical protein
MVVKYGTILSGSLLHAPVTAFGFAGGAMGWLLTVEAHCCTTPVVGGSTDATINDRVAIVGGAVDTVGMGEGISFWAHDPNITNPKLYKR